MYVIGSDRPPLRSPAPIPPIPPHPSAPPPAPSNPSQADRTTPDKIVLWVGAESEMSGERDLDLMELVGDFVGSKGLPQLPAIILHQGEEDEAEGLELPFWDWFVN